jgi:hypothetical protein
VVGVVLLVLLIIGAVVYTWTKKQDQALPKVSQCT